MSLVFAKSAAGSNLLAVEGHIGHLDVRALAGALPHNTGAVIVDHYLTRRDAESSRVIRTLQPVAPHFHRSCDEYVFILSGSGIVWLEDPRHQVPFRPGHLLFFARNVVHAMPRIFERPVLALSVDTPMRAEEDVVYVGGADFETTGSFNHLER